METELGYVSSSPNFIDVDPKQEINASDEADTPALIKIIELIEARKAYYSDIASLVALEDEVTLKEQLLINQKVIRHLDELEVQITGAINKVKEAQYGRR